MFYSGSLEGDMVRTSFDSQLGILDTSFEENVTVDEIVNYIAATRLNRKYPRVLRILTDATTAKMDFSSTELNRIVAENFKSLEEYDQIIDAIVIDSPRVTAMSLLYQDLAESSKYSFEVFSSRQTAMKRLTSQNDE